MLIKCKKKKKVSDYLYIYNIFIYYLYISDYLYITDISYPSFRNLFIFIRVMMEHGNTGCS